MKINSTVSLLLALAVGMGAALTTPEQKGPAAAAANAPRDETMEARRDTYEHAHRARSELRSLHEECNKTICDPDEIDPCRHAHRKCPDCRLSDNDFLGRVVYRCQ